MIRSPKERVLAAVLGAACATCLFPRPSAAADPAKHTGYEFMAGESKLKFYGFTRLDFLYNDSKANDPQIIQWIKSEDDAAAIGASVARPNDSELSIHPKLARFGFDMNTPPVARLGNAKVAGKIEVDFYNGATSESREALRMRHAYVKLGWDETAITIGQLADLIAPLFPVVNGDMVMWNAGNLGDRRAQMRFEWIPAVGEGGKFALQAMVGQTGADDAQDLDAGGGTGGLDGVDAAIPTLQARAGLTAKHPWVAGKTLDIGVWVHTAKEALPEGAAPIGGEEEWDSQAFGFDLKLPLHNRVVVEAEGFSGKNLNDVRGGIGQGVNTTDGTEIEATGGWAQVTVQATDTWAFSVGSTLDNPQDNLPAAGARDKNTVIYVANRFAPGGGLVFGLDYLNWKTDWTGGMAQGKANRVDLFGQFNF